MIADLTFLKRTLYFLAKTSSRPNNACVTPFLRLDQQSSNTYATLALFCASFQLRLKGRMHLK